MTSTMCEGIRYKDVAPWNADVNQRTGWAECIQVLLFLHAIHPPRGLSTRPRAWPPISARLAHDGLKQNKSQWATDFYNKKINNEKTAIMWDEIIVGDN